MKPKFRGRIAAILIGMLCLSCTAGAVDLQAGDDAEQTTRTTEFELVQQASAEWESSSTAASDPMKTYRRLFMQQCRKDADELRRDGYSEDEIALMRDCGKGNASYEDVAAQVSPAVTETLQYVKSEGVQQDFRYSFLWDKTPLRQVDAVFGLDVFGFQGEKRLECQLDDYRFELNYADAAGQSIQPAEEPQITPLRDGCGILLCFPQHAKAADERGNGWVWSGSIELTVSPMDGIGEEFEGMCGRGAYFHAPEADAKTLRLEVSILPLLLAAALLYRRRQRKKRGF